METQRRKAAVAWLSVLSNTTLVLGKLVVGLLIGSVSVISEAIHSGVDWLAAVIALFAVKTSHKAADEEHPFGHGKVENISGTVEALLIFLAAGWIIYEASHKLLHPQPVEAPGWGVGVMLVSSVVNIIVSQMLFRVGRETDSVALQADAWHLRTDVYTSAGVMAGLTLLLAGQRFFPGTNLLWVDPVAAIAVALLIVHTAWKLVLESGRDLLDASLPAEETAWIREHLKGFSPPVRGFHHLRTRKAGSVRFIEFHLAVEQDLSVGESHRFSDTITHGIKARFPRALVTIHVEPCDGECRPACEAGCLLTREEMTADHLRRAVVSS
ncbi:MAG TPA: cation diffusion facilitator family transporter [Candidatus Methylomirabilis sp.]|nr:cation diffusion facilitator family transporter [Candidatus Methylomirabilis sp.]